MPDLGYKPPGGYNVNLGRGYDFIQTLTRKDGADWPDGTVITLFIDDITEWVATLDGPHVSWNVDKDLVNAVADVVGGKEVRCRIDETSADLPWVTGRVHWYVS